MNIWARKLGGEREGGVLLRIPGGYYGSDSPAVWEMLLRNGTRYLYVPSGPELILQLDPKSDWYASDENGKDLSEVEKPDDLRYDPSDLDVGFDPDEPVPDRDEVLEKIWPHRSAAKYRGLAADAIEFFENEGEGLDFTVSEVIGAVQHLRGSKRPISSACMEVVLDALVEHRQIHQVGGNGKPKKYSNLPF